MSEEEEYRKNKYGKRCGLAANNNARSILGLT